MMRTNILHDNAVIGNDKQVLQDIHLRTKNLVVYKRGIEPLKGELSKAIQMSIEYRTSGSVEEIAFSLGSYFANELQLKDDLLKDILDLLSLFEQVTKVSSFRVLLASINNNMCRRFHADINELRMLCTYYGPGTLWLPDNAVNRKAYLSGKGNRNILPDESLVQQVDTGDVVILKGSLYPGATPILHRSPSIEEHSEERILLRIDLNQSLNFPLGYS